MPNWVSRLGYNFSSSSSSSCGFCCSFSIVVVGILIIIFLSAGSPIFYSAAPRGSCSNCCAIREREDVRFLLYTRWVLSTSWRQSAAHAYLVDQYTQYRVRKEKWGVSSAIGIETQLQVFIISESRRFLLIYSWYLDKCLYEQLYLRAVQIRSLEILNTHLTNVNEKTL